MAKKKAEPGPEETPGENMIVLVSPDGGPCQVGTDVDPRHVDSSGRIVLDREKDAELIAQLMDRRIGFTEVSE